MINKQKQKVRKIRVHQKIAVDINYDRLAEAIVKANEKQSQKYSVSREWMKFIIYPVFWGVAIIAGIMSVICMIYGIGTLVSFVNTTVLSEINWHELTTGFLSLCIGFFMITVCLATVWTVKEIDQEKDRQYVASMFSNIVALVALVVSLIALVKG